MVCWGYYPAMLKTKYKKLQALNINFIRYTLPNGKMGWLDIKDEKENDDK